MEIQSAKIATPSITASASNGLTIPQAVAPDRYLSIDIYRGLTIVFMIIVNSPGTWDYIYQPLRHAEWHGCTPADVVFPSFMFISGVAMWFSFAKFDHKWSAEVGWKILRRTTLLFFIGILLNKFPAYWVKPDHWRIMGVLQRLALGYGIASLLVLTLHRRALIMVSAGILLLYWGLLNWFVMSGGDPYGHESNAVLQVDSWVYGLEVNTAIQIEHWIYGDSYFWHGQGFHFDSEGILSTLPAVVTVILGWWSGKLMSFRSRQKGLLIRDLLMFGTMLGIMGLAWDLFFPINKKLWTSSYVLYAGGLSTILLAACIWLIDIRGWRRGIGFALTFGLNPLFAFVFSEAFMQILYEIEWVDGGIHRDDQAWLYFHFFKPIESGNLGSLLFAISYMLFCWLICRWLYARKIFIKI